jgi:hypothetical protein
MAMAPERSAENNPAGQSRNPGAENPVVEEVGFSEHDEYVL